MKATLKSGESFIIRQLVPDDWQSLSEYLFGLSEETKSRFMPHGYEMNAIRQIYSRKVVHLGYIAQLADQDEIIGYAIVKIGYLEYDFNRLDAYGINQDLRRDCTYAPSVADAWQSMGIGNALFGYIRSELISTGIKRIILWGGVQATNHKAIGYYKKHGFRALGKFQHNGENLDMILDIKANQIYGTEKCGLKG